MIYRPWKEQFDDKQNIQEEFFKFIETPACPIHVKIEFNRAKERHKTKCFLREPTNNVNVLKEINPSVPGFQESEDIIKITSELFDNIEDTSDFDHGINYDWSVPNIPLTEEQDRMVETFLSSKIDEHENSKLAETLQIPHKPDGSTYELSDLTNEQSSIVCYFLKYIKTCFLAKPGEKIPQCHITLRGIAGSGKSTLIHTLSTAIKRMFKTNDAVLLCAPTGCAAFNIGGTTCHNAFGISVKKNQSQKLSQKNMKRLKAKFKNVFALIIDERSMISAQLLSSIEKCFRDCMHNGESSSYPWGNLPILLLVGDDFQLPSVQKGMIYAFDFNGRHNTSEVIGFNLFKRAAKKTFELKSNQRQNKKQKKFLNFLKYTRGEDEKFCKTFKEFDLPLSRILNLNNFSQQEIDFLHNDAKTLHLFANREPKEDFNKQKLVEIHNQNNPVAIIKSNLLLNNSNNTSFSIKQPNQLHFGNETPQKVIICRNAIVQLTGRNIMPMWGLYNGSFGQVKDIVFRKNENPNFGNLPRYILVEFNQYNGPIFIKEHPKYVPIVPISVQCQNHCCIKYYIPLSLSFAKTVHTYQGQNVGEVDEGRQENAIQRIIVDPGDKKFEGNNPGISYTISSRGSNMGEHDKMRSAIYYFGENISLERLKNLTVGLKGKKYKKVKLREKWVRFLQKNTKNPFIKPKEKVDLIQWSTNTTFTPKQIQTMMDSVQN